MASNLLLEINKTNAAEVILESLSQTKTNQIKEINNQINQINNQISKIESSNYHSSPKHGRDMSKLDNGAHTNKPHGSPTPETIFSAHKPRQTLRVGGRTNTSEKTQHVSENPGDQQRRQPYSNLQGFGEELPEQNLIPPESSIVVRGNLFVFRT